MRRLLIRHETVLAAILIVALIGLGRANDAFLTLDNLLNQGRLMTEIGLIALPMTFVIVTGGIDLSVGAIVGLCAILLGYSWKNWGLPLPLAIVFALGVGALAGFCNGLVITRLKAPPLIVTIATLALYRGLAEGISKARSVRGYPDWFYVLGQGQVLGAPTQVWLLGLSSPASRSTAPPSGARFTRSGPTRRRRASRPCPSTASSSSSTLSPGSCRGFPPSCSSAE
jgi:rhamnose transport system permease protein